MRKITDLAKVIRSKNAGPFELTLDIMFNDAETYDKVKASEVITKEKIAELYDIPIEKITTFVWFDKANAVKATILRDRVSGSMGDRDVYGAQQHAPLLSLEFPF